MDAQGNVVIQPLYDFAGDFREGRAYVTSGGGFNAIIDKKGNIIYRGTRHQIISQFIHDGFIRISDVLDNYRKEGFMDRNGKLVIPYLFDEARDFENGFAPVCKYTDPFSEDERLEIPDAEKAKRRRWGMIDRRGKLIVPFEYATIFPFHDGLAMIVDAAGQHGYVDTTGKVVIPPQYKNAQSFSEGKAAVKVNGKWGFIDRKGNMVVAPAFIQARGFNDGRASVTNEAGKAGYIDVSGKLVIDYRFDFGNDFHDGNAVVQLDKKYGSINPAGEWLVKPESEEWMYYGEGLWTSTVSGKTGFVDSSGSWVIPPGFSDAMYFENGLAQVFRGGKRTGHSPLQAIGYVNRQGEMIWDFQR
jgi:hypothetical protein